MPIVIYNSLSRQKEEFQPLEAPHVNIYTCGVTVYDQSHIGHARSLFIFDLMRRYFTLRGFKVRFVRNITDIDDKIINRAKEQKVNWRQMVQEYIQSYYDDLAALGIEKGDFEPRATENIADMIEYIQGLIRAGFAYAQAGDVYFSVRKFPSYGKLSGQGCDQMLEGVRIEPSGHKNDPLDFALWKGSGQDEPGWDSPWGRGRPGWHIECSVMSRKFLKSDTLDIHAGGRDLVFPHHENEIAQSEALTGKPFAKYWLHHGLLTINGQKMAKSAGNFLTIKDFLGRYKNPDLLKLFFLSAHYASPIDYSDLKIEEARQALERIGIVLKKISGRGPRFFSFFLKDSRVEALKDKFFVSLDDDFNTPEALACVFELVNLANKNIMDYPLTQNARRALLSMLGILGISMSYSGESGGIKEEEINGLINQRNRARRNKDYELSDRIRNELEAKGIILEDDKDGKTTWRRKL